MAIENVMAAINGKVIAPSVALGPTWEDNNILGAKNLIPYPWEQTSVSGGTLTWTNNGDGTFTASGTAKSGGETIRWRNNRQDYILPAGKYWLSGCPTGGSSTGGTKYCTWCIVYHSDNTNSVYRDGGSGIEITILDTDTYLRGGIDIYPDAGVLSNLTFKPMIRRIEDSDGTYEPFAMTNRQLTKINTPKNVGCTLDSTKVTQGVITGCQIGPIVILHMDAVKLKTSGSPLKINSSVLPRPVSGRAMTNIRAGSQVSSSTSGSDMLGWVDSDGNIQVNAIADNVNYFFYGTFVYVTDQY